MGITEFRHLANVGVTKILLLCCLDCLQLGLEVTIFLTLADVHLQLQFCIYFL